MLNPETSIAFIGGGNMAQAMVSGLIHGGHSPKKILVCDPSIETQTALVNDYQVVTSGNNTFAAKFADVIILAVKPNLVSIVCDELSHAMLSIRKQRLIVSVAAGIGHLKLRELLGGSNRVICAMPNLPSSVGKGMTGLYADPHCDVFDVSLAENVMSCIGETLWLQDEKLMSSMVAAAGSAPAYFFLIMEIMQKVAEEQGMTPDQAKLSVQQSALGAANMAVASGLEFHELRDRVTSPRGTTEQAINAFLDADIEETVRSAMQAAANKASESYRQPIKGQ